MTMLSSDRQKISYGTITFAIYTPNTEKTHEEYVSTHKCTQDEFVNFLKTGILTKDNLNMNEKYK